MMHIEAVSKRVSFSLTLRKKVTIIRGDSGTGKTRLVSALLNRKRSFKVMKSDPDFIFYEVSGESWYPSISPLVDPESHKYIFLIDDENLLRSEDMIRLVELDKKDYFVFIERYDSFNTRSLTDEVYELLSDSSGRNYYLSPYYKSLSLKKLGI